MMSLLGWVAGCASSALFVSSVCVSQCLFGWDPVVSGFSFSFLSSCLGFCFLFLFVHLPKTSQRKNKQKKQRAQARL